MAKTGISAARVITQMVVNGTSSRLELCSRLSLSKAAVTQAVNKLLRAGFIEEGMRVSGCGRGRKTTILRVKPDLAYFVGADLEGMAVRACIIDSEKRIVASGKRAVGPSLTTSKILGLWSNLIEEVVATSGVPTEKIVGMGVGLPGTVYRENFHSRTYLPPGLWVDLNIGQVIDKLNFRANAANNVYCVSEYERRLGAASEAKSFISVLIRYGTGVAVFSDNALMTGEELLTGELGHMRVDVRGPLCVCGQRGCLDVFISGRTLLEKDIHSDSLLRRELTKRGRYLGLGLANLLKVFHPSLLIVNGLYNDYEHDFKPLLLDALSRELDGLRLSVPRIVFGEPVEFKVSIGAAMRAADEFAESYFDDLLRKNRAIVKPGGAIV